MALATVLDNDQLTTIYNTENIHLRSHQKQQLKWVIAIRHMQFIPPSHHQQQLHVQGQPELKAPECKFTNFLHTITKKIEICKRKPIKLLQFN